MFLSPGSHLLLFITWCLMTRLEAYRHMLEGGAVKHNMYPSKVFILRNRHVVSIDNTHHITTIFLHHSLLKKDWEAY